MALVSDVISRALRLLDVTDVGSPVQPQDAQTAMSVLNAMATRWEANGLALGWANVSAVDDTLPAPPEAEEGLAFNLALKLAPEYGMQPSPYVVDQARSSLAELRRDRLVEMPLISDSDLPCSERGGAWNIYTDGPTQW